MPTAETAQQFLDRYGTEATQLAQEASFQLLIDSMVYVFAADELIDLAVEPWHKTIALHRVQFATASLFPDGPEALGASYQKIRRYSNSIETPMFFEGQFHFNWWMELDSSGSNLSRIVKAFTENHDREPFKEEFSTVAGLLSDVSGRDIRWLSQYLFTPGYSNLETSLLSERNSLELPPEQIVLLRNPFITSGGTTSPHPNGHYPAF